MLRKMRQSRFQWLGGSLLALLGAYLLLAYGFNVVAAPLQAASASDTCGQAQHQLVDKGIGPSSKPWTVEGSVEDNNGCDSWLLGMNFQPVGTKAGSTLWQWGIPAKGHLSDGFTLSAQDEVAEAGRTFYGATGARVRTAVVRMSKGKALRIHPKLPTQQLRKRFVWLRNMRYFVYFYPAGRRAKAVTLLSGNGQVIEKLAGLEGGFEGPGV